MFRWTVLISLSLGALRAQTAQVEKKPLPDTVSPTALQVLLEIQQREQKILEYLSRDLEQPIAS